MNILTIDGKKPYHLIVLLCVVILVVACGAEPEATPTPTATPTEVPDAPRNENVEALNAVQAALDEQDFGFAPLLQDDEAQVVLEAINGNEVARLTYPEQPDDPSARRSFHQR